jgi:hypothetical protein
MVLNDLCTRYRDTTCLWTGGVNMAISTFRTLPRRGLLACRLVRLLQQTLQRLTTTSGELARGQPSLWGRGAGLDEGCCVRWLGTGLAIVHTSAITFSLALWACSSMGKERRSLNL